ncbi:MAG: hypothetical protein JSV88_04195 [Candidatus Aminicenantes bacterium]|nr:MAG: hypothetical protein JSV88_04195 [Candidatus Aminicenantes bacterium]
MLKKIVKVILVVMMLFGAFIVVTNLTEPELQGEGLVIVTYYKNVPACYGPPVDCNDFTRDPEPN